MGSRRRLLERLIALYDRHERPVPASELADRLGTDPDAVRDHLAALRSSELVETDGTGWVPTVTGRELLALDVDPEGFVIVDVPDEGHDGN
jgi:predicted transcriptional regulator